MSRYWRYRSEGGDDEDEITYLERDSVDLDKNFSSFERWERGGPFLQVFVRAGLCHPIRRNLIRMNECAYLLQIELAGRRRDRHG